MAYAKEKVVSYGLLPYPKRLNGVFFVSNVECSFMFEERCVYVFEYVRMARSPFSDFEMLTSQMLMESGLKLSCFLYRLRSRHQIVYVKVA